MNNKNLCLICKKRINIPLKEHFKTSHKKDELQTAIVHEKIRGLSDIEIGQKYGVSFNLIEKAVLEFKGINISRISRIKKIKSFYPKRFQEEQTTVWSFKQRGKWATHSGVYRGNWSPYIPRNVILKYSKEGETVLDYFCGAGTTVVEAKLLGRKCIALDINDVAIELAKKNVDFEIPINYQLFPNNNKPHKIYEPKLLIRDARDLSFLEDSSIDLICAHPPYANIIHYTNGKNGDLSYLNIKDFLSEMSIVAKESFRILKPGRQCAILIGDTRRKKHIIPIGFKLINVFLNEGFKLKELIIKRQHNCKTTGFWYEKSIKYNFLLMAHEYLTIFEKPKSPIPLSIKEKVTDYGYIVPSLKKPSLKKKLKEFETTTVWILPEKNFEKQLNKNVVDRYAKGKSYSTIFLISNSENKAISTFKKEWEGKKELIFIKSSFPGNNTSYLNINSYLQGIKKIINSKLSTIKKGGFFIIQTRDIRINGYIEPLAKKILDSTSPDRLWLKEIVIVTKEKQHDNIKYPSENLKINHQYLLIYEVK